MSDAPTGMTMGPLVDGVQTYYGTDKDAEAAGMEVRRYVDAAWDPADQWYDAAIVQARYGVMSDELIPHAVLLPVAVAEIAAERERGWANFHPEDFCHRCGSRNPSWFSESFNVACGPHSSHQWNGIICPACFAELHEAATGERITWEITAARRTTRGPIMSDAFDDFVLELRIAARNLWAEVSGVVVRHAPWPRRWREDALDALYRHAVATSDLEDDLEDQQRRGQR